ncbi:MAG: diacylglycerol kinase family protein [Bacteroidota bacterium]|nr:diacylglycerol kinase family protein [Bacteroidota bacterium]
MMENKYTIIINPAAGSGLGKKNWDNVRSLLKSKGISYTAYFTNDYESTINYCHEQIDLGARDFIVIGGDGTMNEIANSIFSQSDVDAKDFSLSVIPVGTGNDWCRTFKIPFDYKKAIEIISKGNFMYQDVGKVSFYVGNEKHSRYFVNVAGMGFDAFVAYKTNLKAGKGRGSAFSYLWNLLRSLFQYRSTDTNIRFDGEKFANMVFSISIGIGKYNGGGMMQCPNAVPNDGLFDITIINKMNKLEIIRNIKRLYDGSHIDHPKIDSFRSRKIKLESEPPIKIEVDGEVCGNSPFEFEIVPQGLKIGVPG